MRFKVGDMVRPTREHLINAIENNVINYLEYINGFQILKIEDNHVFYYLDKKNAFYKAEYLELVPEEPEFEYGEEIEVTNDGNNWLKRIFITKSKECRYVCVDCTCHSSFKNGRQYTVAFYEAARKLKPTLSRKEIAEKFGVAEDFCLVD